MQTNMTLKQRVIVFSMGLALALAVAGALGLRGLAHPARVAAQPVSVAVNWNGFGEFAMVPQG